MHSKFHCLARWIAGTLLVTASNACGELTALEPESPMDSVAPIEQVTTPWQSSSVAGGPGFSAADGGNARDAGVGNAVGVGGFGGSVPMGTPQPGPRQDCPAEPPKANAPCAGVNDVCTYHRDGPCGKNPDVIAVGFSGKWGFVAAAIACPGWGPPPPQFDDAGVE